MKMGGLPVRNLRVVKQTFTADIFFFPLCFSGPYSGVDLVVVEVSRSHTFRLTTLARAPLDE